MPIGPNDDGAELYRMYLEAMTCEICGGCKEDRELHIFQIDNEKLQGGRNINISVDKLIMEYTEIRSCVVKGMPDACTVWLRVGVQQFCVTPEPCENKDEAQFMQCNLARALWRLLYEERDGLEGK